jgi:hypothetical protein
MKLSYAVTVCNEINEIERLLPFLVEHKREQDEVVVLFDSTNGSKSVEEYLRSKSVNQVGFRWHSTKFEGNFSDLKNTLTGMCAGDYVFQIDADEMPTEYMMKLIPQIIEANPVDLIRVPRINTVDGLTENHIKMWHWSVNENGWVNYPDYQWRIYKNDPRIRWFGGVHEKILGHSTYAHLPAEETDLALRHHKTIDRQEKQNSYYDSL